jgi:hypothetical protein
MVPLLMLTVSSSKSIAPSIFASTHAIIRCSSAVSSDGIAKDDMNSSANAVTKFDRNVLVITKP